MAYSYTYKKHNWTNNTYPAINEDHLNEMEDGIARVYEILNTDVVKVDGNKQLSSNDFTKEYMDILSIVDPQPSLNSNNLVKSGGVYKKNKEIEDKIEADKSELKLIINGVANQITQLKNSMYSQGTVKPLATVATTGDYNDLLNRPDIPSMMTSLERKENRVYTINDASSDSTYPSAKAVYDFVRSQINWYEGEYR